VLIYLHVQYKFIRWFRIECLVKITGWLSPPNILFLGFTSTLIPFAYAYAGIQTKPNDMAIGLRNYVPTLMCASRHFRGWHNDGWKMNESLNFGGMWAGIR
jgi:cytochrome c biogenesis factor